MIVGLITLIVVMGGATFWPRRLVQMKLVDGRVVLGEVAGRQTFPLSRDQLNTLPPIQRQRAEELMGSNDQVMLDRVRLRVDNKRINGDTYIWINDIARAEAGTSHPDWAMTIERLSWGRFLGFPKSYTVLRPRPVSGTEQQLTKLIEFIKNNLPEANANTHETLMEAVAELEGERADVRAQSTAKFLGTLPKVQGNVLRRAIGPSHETSPLRDVTPTTVIIGVREIYSGPKSSWSAFQRFQLLVDTRSQEIKDIEDEELAELSRRLNDARMDTVRASLNLETSLEPLARRLAEQDAALAALTHRLESRRQMVASISRRFGQNSAVPRAFTVLVAELAGPTRSHIAKIKQKLAALEQKVPSAGAAVVETYREIASEVRSRTIGLTARLAELEERQEAFVWHVTSAGGIVRDIPAAEVVRAFPANQLGFWGRLGVYFDRWGEFLTADPREANMEGGVLPAIWGTVVMTLIMTIAAVPFGVLAALYLREYAKAGPVVSAVRVAVNNLAGVPSIVFGVFGLGFFCYVVGGQVDQIFYPEYVAQNKPVFETGGLLWASLTLALLTLPVVIVATEEALSAVPNSLREGSYACGASKWQTIWRIVLPRAMPGIMTGTILAMARGAGEVAPLMLVGAVKIAPSLPVDMTFPYLHPSRSFMHLGFHIYDLGFQSPDSEAARPMVFTTTLLLITIIGVLNIAAIMIRNRLRRRFSASQF